ncbi:MAG: patatin-like phospholipase family protein [Prolixibacteraceae bacterium]|nr:patatin-like phospholipase family protein [Prolixibacteraceae bacterium]
MKKNVTLVLSGGGARGFAHIGAIEAIESRGYTINSIAGTSMGALVGGVYAVGKMNEYKEWVYNLDKQEIFKLLDFSFSSHGLIKGDKVFNTMKKFIPDANIEDLNIKYTATAFDLANNKEVVFNKGSLYDAIRASVSIPTVFTPVVSENSVFVDGGVVNNIPINNAIRIKDDILIAVYVNADIPLNRTYLTESEKVKRQDIYKKRIAEFKKSVFKSSTRDQNIRFNYFNLINNTISAATHYLANTIMKSNPPDILIEISHHSCKTFDFYKAEELVEIGRYAAHEKFDSILID